MTLWFREFDLGEFNAQFSHALQNFCALQDRKDELSVTIAVSWRMPTPVVGMQETRHGQLVMVVCTR